MKKSEILEHINNAIGFAQAHAFKMVSDTKYHGGKKSVFRNGFASSVSRISSK